jgi:peptidyl-prolyl cis-trans isomerase D
MIEGLKRYLSAGKHSGKRKITLKMVVAVVLFSAIIVVFVFFGMPTSGTGSLAGYAARVNNKYISLAELQEEVNRREQYFRQFSGALGGADDREKLRQEALESLVERELLNQAARKSGIEVSDEEVIEFISKEMADFQENGRFQREFYRRFLEASGQSAGQFEDRIRQHLRGQRSMRLFEVVGKPSKMETEKETNLKSVKLNVDFLKIDKNQVSDEVLAELESAVTAADDKKLGELVKAKGLRWDETGPFDFTQDFVPKLNSSVASLAAFELTQDKPLLNRVVRDGEVKYVLKLKSLNRSETAPAPSPMEMQMARFKSYDLVSRWLKEQRETARIELNPAALSGR